MSFTTFRDVLINFAAPTSSDETKTHVVASFSQSSTISWIVLVFFGIYMINFTPNMVLIVAFSDPENEFLRMYRPILRRLQDETVRILAILSLQLHASRCILHH